MSDLTKIQSEARPNKIASLSPIRRRLLLGTVMLIMALILFVLAELAVRTRMYVKFGTFWGFQSIKVADRDSGLEYPRANYSTGAVTINSMGFRSPEIKVTKPHGTTRFAFLGGSTTFCQEVTNSEYVWPTVVKNVVQDNYPDRRFEHINASVTGFTTIDSLTNLNDRVAHLEPDVIFIYHSVNDIAHNMWSLADSQGIATLADPNPWLLKVMKISVLADLVYKNLLLVKINKKESNDTLKAKYDDEYMVSRFRKSLNELVERALEVSPYVVIPTFTNRLRADQSPEQRAISAELYHHTLLYFKTEDVITALESYNNVIREMAYSDNVIVMDTELALEGTSDNFVDSVHFTDAGSKRFGVAVANFLVQSKII